MKYPVGTRFLDYQYQEQMVWGYYTINGIEQYVVNDPNKEDDRVHGDLMTESDMETILSKQEKFKAGLTRRQESEAEEQRKIEKERCIQTERECLYGFDDGLTPMQRGKILKTLMKVYRYDCGVMTRKDFIVAKVKGGCTFEQKTYGQSYNHRAKKDTVTVFGCYYPNTNEFSRITKTECDFANYLINNKIFENEMCKGA